ncbi:MAG: V-type ATP synthase subunit I [Candidatus Heimdallarchaeota archaeon]
MSLVPERMKTVKVVIPKDCSRNLLRYLSSTEDIQIIDIHKTPFDLNSFESGPRIKDLSDEFDKVIKHFKMEDNPPSGKPIQIDDSDLGNVMKETEKLVKDVLLNLSQINDRIVLAEKELKSNQSVIEIAKNLTPFGFSFEDLDDERPYFSIIVGRLETKRVARFKWNLDAITDSNFVFKESDVEGDQAFVAVGFLERYQDDVNRLLAAYGFEKYNVPERISGNVEKVITKSQDKIEVLENKLTEYEKEATDLIQTYGHEILAYGEQMNIEENYMKISNMTRESKKNIAFWGWVPQKKIKKVEKTINDLSECEAIIEFQTPVFDESEYPTKADVPKVMKVYNSLVNGYGTPGYGEYNPAIIFQIFFPIMFGIMFADVIHGGLFMLMGIWGLTMRNKVLGTNSFIDEIKGYFKSGAWLVIISGAMGMVFGVLFGSYGGMTHHVNHAIPEPLWFSPESHDLHNGAKPVILMVELSLVIGMVHMSIGYLLRFINNIKHKHYTEAFLVTLMWIIFHWGLFILVFSVGTNFMSWFDSATIGDFDMALFSLGGEAIKFIKNIPALWFFVGTMGVPLIVMSVYLLVAHKLDGFGELLEITLSTLSHTVSYARIFAMNAVHGALSHIFLFLDDEGHMTWQSYVGVVVGSLVILVLEGLFSFIQSLRLQWVEFLGKVGYQGSGFPFTTMAIERKYSQMARK